MHGKIKENKTGNKIERKGKYNETNGQIETKQKKTK